MFAPPRARTDSAQLAERGNETLTSLFFRLVYLSLDLDDKVLNRQCGIDPGERHRVRLAGRPRQDLHFEFGVGPCLLRHQLLFPKVIPAHAVNPCQMLGIKKFDRL